MDYLHRKFILLLSTGLLMVEYFPTIQDKLKNSNIEDVGSLITTAKSNSLAESKVDGMINGKEYLIKATLIGESKESNNDNVEQTYIHESTGETFLLGTNIDRKANHIEVPTILQYPELPNGCEITSLTSVLNYYGINVSKTIMADDYLPQVPFKYENGKKTGPNPHKAFAGNPRHLKGGWYVFADPIVKSAKDVIDRYEMNLKVENVSGSTQEEILSYIDQNIPVVIWVTLDLSPPIKRGGWYIEGTNEFHSSFINLHSVVLEGWEAGDVHIIKK
ncbi:C39 family peptidase [Paenisporosarcina sp. TG20]|uniref:C39 family peptidase n=1 Tax=Paenisporosarcina sp. TG20 TaxID=1211706 RepID=UPI00035C9406|nr:C39 family peptidase [Paenisporosarcina sp. TG20]